MRGLGRRGKESGAEGCRAERRGCGCNLVERRGSVSGVREGRVE